MAKISGNEAKISIKKAPTWGTEPAIASGDLVQVNSLSWDESVDTIDSNNIGAGLGMRTSLERGNVSHELSLDMAVGYENKADVLLASFFGDPQTPVEQNVGEGDYLHRILASTTLNDNAYVSVVAKITSTETISLPTVSIESITLSHEEAPGDLTLEVSGLASDLDLTPINNAAALNASTVANQLKVKVTRGSYWLINPESSGALATSANEICPISATLELTRPQVVYSAPCNTTGTGAPGSDGFLEGTLTLELSGLDDLTYFTAAAAETSYKAKFHVEGAQIGAGDPYTFEIYLPKLVLEASPDYSLSEAGDNPVTLTFNVLAATVSPTGFSSPRPYLEIINTRSTVY
jgi:hypothetical protein